MKKIINGKKYDTKTAAFLFQTYQDFGVRGKLYRKTTGEFFVWHINNFIGENDSIEPISEDRAKVLIGEYDGDMYEEIFGKVEE